MTKQITVSVIIPAYNAESYIIEAIDSVIAQTWPNVECIVVDDGSIDSTVDKVMSYGERVQLVRQENQERSVARNVGVEFSCGDFISFLDADDYITVDKISRQLEFLSTHSGCELVYSDSCYFYDNGIRNFRFPRRKTPSGNILSGLIYENHITVNSPLISREAFDRCGGFDPKFSHYEDWDLLLRLALTGTKFEYLKGCNAYCRRHESNTDLDRLSMKEGKWRVVEKISSRYQSYFDNQGLSAERFRAFHKADLGRALFYTGKTDEGLLLIREACEQAFPGRNLFRAYVWLGLLFGPGATKLIERLNENRKGWQK